MAGAGASYSLPLVFPTISAQSSAASSAFKLASNSTKMANRRGRGRQQDNVGGGGSWRSTTRESGTTSASTWSQGAPTSQSKFNNHQMSGRGRGRGGTLKTPPLSRMDLIASVSRSSGLEKGGDDLKESKIQEEYREYIQEKLDELMRRFYPRRFLLETEKGKKQRLDSQENLLILFRKLREGIYSSRRRDTFAVEVYETSLYLSVIFESEKQTASIIPHLIPDVYRSSSFPQSLRLPTLILSLLYHLVASYPSQSTYRRQLKSIPEPFFPRDSKLYVWLAALSASLRNRNYSKFEQLSRKSCLSLIFESSDAETLNLESLSISRPHASQHLANMAFLIVLDRLREKARDTAWSVLRSAYRELSCDSNSENTQKWLSRSLLLRSPLSTDLTLEPEMWLEKQAAVGHTRRKEGVEGKWIVCKVR